MSRKSAGTRLEVPDSLESSRSREEAEYVEWERVRGSLRGRQDPGIPGLDCGLHSECSGEATDPQHIAGS